jgi:hypothetical protein
METSGPSAFVELETVLKRSARLCSVEVQRLFLRSIFDEALRSSGVERDYVAITDAFIKMCPGECDVSSEVCAFISRALQTRRPRFQLSGDILRFHLADTQDLDGAAPI